MRKSHFAAAVCLSLMAGTASAQYLTYSVPSYQYRAPVVPQYQFPMVQQYAGPTAMYPQPYANYSPPQPTYAPQYTYRPPQQYVPQYQPITPYAGATAMYPRQYMYTPPAYTYRRW
jgi:hypothetical protein